MKDSILFRKSQELVQQKKKYFLLKAVTSALALLLFVALAASLTDIAFELSGLARWINLLLSATIALLLGLKVFFPAVGYSRSTAIREMERHHPETGQALRTYEQYSGQGALTAPMAQTFKMQVDSVVKPINPRAIIPWRKLKPLLISLVAFLAVTVVLLLTYPPFPTALVRCLNPSSGLQFTNFEDISYPREFVAGESPMITSRITGRIPQQVQLKMVVDGMTAPKIVNLKPDKDGICSYEVKGIESSFKFQFVKGEAQSNIYAVDFMVPPSIEKSVVSLKYPAYTGIAVKKQEAMNIRALSGSIASWLVTTTVPMKKASLVIEKGQYFTMNTSGNRLEVQLEIPPGKNLYYLEGEDQYGQKLKTELFDLHGFKDGLPQVRFVKPRDSVTVTSITDLPLQVKATDDFGIKEMGIGLYFDEKPEKVIFSESFTNSGVTTKDLSEIFYLEELDLSINSSLSLFAYAMDYKNETRVVSDIISIDIKQFDKRIFKEDNNQEKPPSA